MRSKPEREEPRSYGPTVASVKEAVLRQTQIAGGGTEHSHTVWRVFVLWQPEVEEAQVIAVVLGQGGATVSVDGWQVTTVSSRSEIGSELYWSRLGDITGPGQVIGVDGGPILPLHQRRQREPLSGQAAPGTKARDPITPEAGRSTPADGGQDDGTPIGAATPCAESQSRTGGSVAPPASERVASREALQRFCSAAYPAIQQRCETLLASLPALLEPGPAPQALRVAFIGQFKTGKSRLLNALIGEDLLPYGVGECTAGVTTLRHGPRNLYFAESGDQQEEITRQRFERLVNAQEQDSVPAVDRAFRIESPCPALGHLTLLDTPGYNGTQVGTAKRAQVFIQRAASQADLWVLVLATGIAEQDVQTAREVLPECAEMVVLLNQSDNFDAEQIKEIRADALAQFQRLAAVSPPWFTVSTLWQTAAFEDREQLMQDRHELQDVDEEPVHEWREFTQYLSTKASRRCEGWAWKQVGAGDRACALALEIERTYDIRAQAEHTFLSHLPALQRLLAPPLGPAILQQAVKAVREGRPLPWALLANFGVTPSLLAPRLALSEELVPQIREKCLALPLEMGRKAYERYDHDGLQQLREAAARLCASSPQPGSLGERQRERFEWWEWCTGCLDAKFEYASFFDDLRGRWVREPERIGADTKAVCQQLREALVSVSPMPSGHPLPSVQQATLRRRGAVSAARGGS